MLFMNALANPFMSLKKVSIMRCIYDEEFLKPITATLKCLSPQ